MSRAVKTIDPGIQHTILTILNFCSIKVAQATGRLIYNDFSPQNSPFLLQALYCADIHSGKKGSSTLRNAPFFLKTYCNSTLYVLAVRKLHSTMSFRRCLSVHMFAFLGRQLYFYTAGKRKEEREKKRKESKLL